LRFNKKNHKPNSYHFIAKVLRHYRRWKKLLQNC